MMIDDILFGIRVLEPNMIIGKKIIDVGAYNVNGSFRDVFLKYKPEVYIGVDMVSGSGVDEICNVENIVEKYGSETFDFVVSASMLEHVQDWKTAIKNMKSIVKKNGYIMIMMPAIGFRYHAYPYDYWRYEEEDLLKIMCDFEVICTEHKSGEQPMSYGLFKKPEDYVEKSIDEISLFSILSHKREQTFRDDLYKEKPYKRMIKKKKLNKIYDFPKVILKKIFKY